MSTIIATLEAKRKELDLSYEKLAEIAKSSKGNVHKILTGKAKPMAESLFAIADALGYDFPFCQKGSYIIADDPKQPLSAGETKKAKKAMDNIAKTRIGEKVQNIKEQNECANCTYSETGSGIRIRTIKCADCKKKK